MGTFVELQDNLKQALLLRRGWTYCFRNVRVYVFELGMQVGSHLVITVESGFNYTKWHLS